MIIKRIIFLSFLGWCISYCVASGLYGFTDNSTIVSIDTTNFRFTPLFNVPVNTSDPFISTVDESRSRLFFNAQSYKGEILLIMYDILNNSTREYYGLGLGSTYLGGPSIFGFFPDKGNEGTVYAYTTKIQNFYPFIPLFTTILSLDVETGIINYVYNFTTNFTNTWNVQCGAFDPVNGNMAMTFVESGLFDFTTPTLAVTIDVLQGTLINYRPSPFPTYLYPLSMTYNPAMGNYISTLFNGTIELDVTEFVAFLDYKSYEITKIWESNGVNPLMMLTIDTTNNIAWMEAAGEIGNDWDEALYGIDLTSHMLSTNVTVVNTGAKILTGLVFLN